MLHLSTTTSLNDCLLVDASRDVVYQLVNV